MLACTTRSHIAFLLGQKEALLVVCPAGFVLAKERGTQEHVLMIIRTGSGVPYSQVRDNEFFDETETLFQAWEQMKEKFLQMCPR